MISDNPQPPEYSKKRSMILGLIIIALAVVVFYMNRFINQNYIVQARLVTVGIMGFLLIYDWRAMYLDLKNKNRR